MSNFQPTVVMGIGGTGKNILLSLKKMIVENSPNGMKDFPVLKLFSLDTDVRIEAMTSEIQTIKDELKLDPNTEMFRLGGDGIASTLDLDSFPEIKSWFPYSKRHQLNPNMLAGGASQMKPVGRFSFAWNAESLRQKIQQLLSDTVSSDTSRKYNIGENNLEQFTNVFICGSVCGGTGSGTFLDLAYLVRFVAAQLGIVVKIYGMFALASVYENYGGDLKMKPNCYASLVELDHFMNEANFGNKHRRFFPSYRNVNSSVWDYRNAANNAPFDYPYIFDKTNESGLSFGSPKEFADMVARFIYLLTGSEVADKWQSMNNNVDPAVNKNESTKNKPIKYRSMGAFALLYPRRKITQICAYKLASEYFKIILDSSYTENEISNLVTRFLDDTKVNPESDLLKENFDLYRMSSDSIAESFISFIDTQVDNKISECESADKKDIEELIRHFKDDMEKEIAKFKAQNSVRARDVRTHFINELDKKISEFVDLKLVEDLANPPLDGGKKMVRGSIVRACDFVKLLLEKFENAAEYFRKEEENTRESIKDYESDYESKLSDLKEAIDSFNPFTKGKIKECYEAVLDSCKEIFTAKRNNLIAIWIRQLLNEITENNIHIADGILKDLDTKRLNLQNGITKFKNIQVLVDDYIYKNKSGNATNFCDVLFDYKIDVENMFENVTKGDAISEILENLSAKLKSNESYGNSYEKLGLSLADQRILTILLKNTEEPFFKPVSEVNIANRLIETKDKKDNLISGTYTGNAKVYIRLNGQEMSIAGLNITGKEFFAITIPNESEYDRYCKNLTQREAGKPFVCPYEDGGDKVNSEEPCPKVGKCLKSWILKGSKTDLVLIPSENKSEINILKTIAGFPLRAVTSVSGPYREEYIKELKKNQKENESEGRNEELLHMFGSIKLADISEAVEKPKEIEDRFKENLILALALNRLYVEKAAVTFLSQSAMVAGKENPDYFLGQDFNSVLELAQSIHLEDIEKVKEVTNSMNYELKEFDSPSGKEDLFGILEDAYNQYSKELPVGMTENDIDILDVISMKYCEKHVKTENVFSHSARVDRLRRRTTSQEQVTQDLTQNIPPTNSQPQITNFYNVAVNGASTGPFNGEQLRQMVSSGQLNAQSLVWTNGMTNWTQASQVSELASLFMTPPPIPGMPPIPPAL